jgi:hypothetical protein
VRVGYGLVRWHRHASPIVSVISAVRSCSSVEESTCLVRNFISPAQERRRYRIRAATGRDDDH